MQTNNLRRKELACGETRDIALDNYGLSLGLITTEGIDFPDVEIVQDERTKMWQVFRKRQDRTVKHPVKRESRTDFGHYHRKLLLILEPGELITMRLKGQTSKRNLSITWDDLFIYLNQCAARAAIAARKAARKEKVKNRKKKA